jgi:hypothetical protein
MSYCRQFDQFDPFTGPVPRGPFAALGDIAQRARKLLRDASPKQLIELAEVTEWIIDGAVREAKHQNEDDDPFIWRSQRSDAQWLDDRLYYYDLSSDQEKFPKHHHAFAVLALWLVADALVAAKLELDVDGTISPSDLTALQWLSVGKYTIDAMEAVCIAEGRAVIYFNNRLDHIFPTVSADNVEDVVKKRISTQAQAAAIESHKANHAARHRALELYAARNWPSVNAAAQTIAPMVAKTQRAVANWIYEMNKQRARADQMK